MPRRCRFVHAARRGEAGKIKLFPASPRRAPAKARHARLQTNSRRRANRHRTPGGRRRGRFRQHRRQPAQHASQARRSGAPAARDHFIGCGREEDRNTGSWLIACALDLATDLAGELDAIGRAQRAASTDDTLAQQVQALRKRAHQLQAATRAADHFLDQDHITDRDTGSWLIACAMGLAGKLASDLDDGIAPLSAPAAQSVIDHHDSAMLRRVAATAGPRRGAA
jgi:hypothetical protein